MSQKLYGNIAGLSPAAKRAALRLYTRKLDPDKVLPVEIATELCTVAEQLRRRVGLLITRDGEVSHVVVGTREILYLPELGRVRSSDARLRRLRLAFSDMSKNEEPTIPHDIYTDLEKLRFDMVVAVKQTRGGLAYRYAHLIPSDAAAQLSQGPRGTRLNEAPIETVLLRTPSVAQPEFRAFISELESEFTSKNSAGRQVKNRENRALLVGVYGPGHYDPEGSIAELRELTRTAGIEIVDCLLQFRRPDPRTLLGKGKLEELELAALRLDCDMVVFDLELKPTQWRVITNTTDLKILDRSMVILDIFAQRATSGDGRTQVELAQLKYNLPRLVERDVGLSRLTGGIGGRGPGETKLEIGRRRARDRIAMLEKRIDKLGEQRDLRRRRRVDNRRELVAILGYTNAGKSTLFNALTKSEVLAEDKLFATLEPSQRRFFLPHQMNEDGTGYVPGKEIVLSDTVGFIRDLPDELRNAFRATLEELYSANLLVHVVDASSAHARDHFESVLELLREMELLDVPRITVLNKVDEITVSEREALERELHYAPESEGLMAKALLSVSALHREGFEALIDSVRDLLAAGTSVTYQAEKGEW